MSLLDYWDTTRPSTKRRKFTPEVSTPQPKPTRETRKASKSETQTPNESPTVNADSKTGSLIQPAPADEGPLNDEGAVPPSSQTELESALPSVETNNNAIEEYELSQKVKDGDEPELSLHERMRDGNWSKGKSSIYVDAFNLALDTVLDEEAHLFSEAEKEVFQHWRALSYESQYLFVFSSAFERCILTF